MGNEMPTYRVRKHKNTSQTSKPLLSVVLGGYILNSTGTWLVPYLFFQERVFFFVCSRRFYRFHSLLFCFFSSAYICMYECIRTYFFISWAHHTYVWKFWCDICGTIYTYVWCWGSGLGTARLGVGKSERPGAASEAVVRKFWCVETRRWAGMARPSVCPLSAPVFRFLLDSEVLFTLFFHLSRLSHLSFIYTVFYTTLWLAI